MNFNMKLIQIEPLGKLTKIKYMKMKIQQSQFPTIIKYVFTIQIYHFIVS